jgi:VCBS repeat protein/ASPIC/UnbV protein
MGVVMARRDDRWAVMVLLVVSLEALGSSSNVMGRPSADSPQPENGTQAMAALLKERAASVDPTKLKFIVNDRRAELLAEEVRQQTALSSSQLTLRFSYARELLHSGRIEDAVKTLDAVAEDARAQFPEVWRNEGLRLLSLKATAYMRMAEEQNCSLTNKDACLLPIRGQGIHKKREGGTRAIETLEEILSLAPHDLQARWLLNVAHMTLGSYPGGVREPFLIPPDVFASEHPLPRFDNVAKEAGVDVFGLAGGAIMEDFDGDGRLDLMISHMGFADQTRLFHNRGDGTFEDRTQRAGIVGEVGGLNMVSTDYNNDGRADVLILRGGWMGSEGSFPLSLLRNDGDGRFSDVTVAVGLLHFAPTQTAAWFDYDGDGWLDLFVGNESDSLSERNPCQLFHNNGDGTFTDVARDAGVDLVAFVKAVAAGDYDNDGRPDLYLTTQRRGNVLFHNDGPTQAEGERPVWRFSDRAAAAGVTQPLYSFGTFFFDYDNDGWLDLFVTGYKITLSMARDVTADRLGLATEGERGRLYHNEGNGAFKDVTRDAGLYRVVPGMGLNFGDLDGDGFLDIYQGTGNPDLASIVGSRMFRNAEGRRFQDVTTAGNFGHLQKGHAISFGDLDNDGDEDVFAQMGGAFLTDNAHSALYKNPGNLNSWLGIELVGVRSNRKAIGARIKVTVDTRSGPRSIYRTVGSGGSFGANPFRQQIGLGDALRIASLEVFWPATGQRQQFSKLDLKKRYEIREGVDVPRRVNYPRFALPNVPGDALDRVLTRK